MNDHHGPAHGGQHPGSPGTGQPGWDALLTGNIDPGVLLPVAALAVAYLVGVVVLRRRSVRWSYARTASWIAGLASALVVTTGGVGAYGARLLSVHMAQHMVLSMLTPILLLAAAPVTLALRALPVTPRSHGGPRRLLLALLHSRVAKVGSHPGFTAPVFVASLYGLYFTALLDLAMSSHIGHVLMLLHFVFAGLIFFGPILAVDPWPQRSSPAVRLAQLLPTIPFHAFFGVALMQAQQPVSQTFAAATDSLGMDPTGDQALAGGIAWGFGEIPILAVIGIVFVQWQRSDSQQARRMDRQADRTGDHRLAAYNARLAALHGAPTLAAGGHGPRTNQAHCYGDVERPVGVADQ